MSIFNGTDAVCAFLSFNTNKYNATWTPQKLADKLREAWDINATWAERTLINPPVRQYHIAKCLEDFWLIQQSLYVPTPGRINMIWVNIVPCGIFAWISICLNFSLVVVTYRHIKEHKVCNWLLAFDALCQFFNMSLYVVNLSALMFGVSVIDFRICMITSLTTVMGMHSTMITIFLISLERMLLTVAPMRLNQLQTPKSVRACTVLAVCISTAYGFYMSWSTILYLNDMQSFNINYFGILYCPPGASTIAISSSKGYILLLLALLDYAIIFAFLLRRYFIGVTSVESIRRVLRAIFILSLIVIVGWLIMSCNNQINDFCYKTLMWSYRELFGIPETTSTNLDSFINIYNLLIAMFYWLSIVASAGGPLILYISSTEYRTAYDKMFSRASVTTTQIGPLFIQQHYKHGITTQEIRNTTVLDGIK